MRAPFVDFMFIFLGLLAMFFGLMAFVAGLGIGIVGVFAWLWQPVWRGTMCAFLGLLVTYCGFLLALPERR